MGPRGWRGKARRVGELGRVRWWKSGQASFHLTRAFIEGGSPPSSLPSHRPHETGPALLSSTPAPARAHVLTAASAKAWAQTPSLPSPQFPTRCKPKFNTPLFLSLHYSSYSAAPNMRPAQFLLPSPPPPPFYTLSLPPPHPS